MNLVLDIGNTQFKLSIFQNNQQVYHRYLDNIDAPFIEQLMSKYAVLKVIFSDTRGINPKDIQKLFPTNIPIIELTHQTKLPLTINYLTPQTLGKDRIAAAVGAITLFPGNPVLIIDIGTAITIDFVSETHEFTGGIISPGQELRFKALHTFTGKLPLVKPTEQTKLSGYSTETAIQFGVQNGIAFEINEYITRYNKQYADLKVVITGGDAYLFEKKINFTIFAEPFLVPIGLNSINNYNA